MYSTIAAAVCVLVLTVDSKILPENVYKPCSRLDPNLAKCITNQIYKPELIEKGVPEINLPPLDPLKIDQMVVNQTLNELVSINAVVRNSILKGFKNLVLEEVKYDRVNGIVDVRVKIPELYWEIDYDVLGQILIIPLRSKGHMEALCYDLKNFFRAYLTTIVKDKVEYYQIRKLEFVGRVGDARVKMTSHNPELQFTADLIQNFFNENPREFMDAINPIYVKNGAEFLKGFINNFLLNIPANELIID